MMFETPKEILVFFVNRKITVRDTYLTEASKYRVEPFGKPLFILIN